MEFIATHEELRKIYKTPRPTDGPIRKELKALDGHCRSFIARSPFVLIGSSDGAGNADVTPKGDKAGFALVLDDRTIAIPDRPGNNRLDTLENIIRNPSVGLLFLIPGMNETLRVNGRAVIVRDPAALAPLVVAGKAPKLAIRVSVREAYLHWARSFRRARLWDPAARVPRSTLPSLGTMVMEMTKTRYDEAVDQRVEESMDKLY